MSYLPNFTLLSSYGYSKDQLETGDETPTAKVASKDIFFAHFPQPTSFQSFTIKPASKRRASALQFGLDPIPLNPLSRNLTLDTTSFSLPLLSVFSHSPLIRCLSTPSGKCFVVIYKCIVNLFFVTFFVCLQPRIAS